jgi:hypothetical protein
MFYSDKSFTEYTAILTSIPKLSIFAGKGFLMKKRIEDLTVIGTKLTDSFFVIKGFTRVRGLPEIKPGQFVQALVTESPSTFLRRPLSVHDIDYRRKHPVIAGSDCRSGY